MKNDKIESNMIFKKVTSILNRYGAKEINIFGSYARGEEKKTSDLDIIIGFSERKSLFDIVRIEQGLSESLGIRVDLLSEKSISPYLIDRIKMEFITPVIEIKK